MIEITNDERLRTLFGKKELLILRKQLLGVNLTPSEKTRLSRNIKKKLEAISLLCPYKEEFNLKKGAEVNRHILEAKEVIKEHSFFPRIEKIIVFGSTATGSRTLDSDIDIGVIFTKITKEQATQFRIDIAGKLPELVDIQVHNTVPKKIKNAIEKGNVIYERKN